MERPRTVESGGHKSKDTEAVASAEGPETRDKGVLVAQALTWLG